MTAVWTADRTWTTGELVTAAIMNTYIRDNLDFLKTPATSGKVTWAADFTTASASFVDVTSATTTFTTYGGGVDVMIRITTQCSATSTATFNLVVDGSTNYLLGAFKYSVITSDYVIYLPEHIPALSAGSHTIKLQAKVSSGTMTIRGTTAAVGDPLFYCREAGA